MVKGKKVSAAVKMAILQMIFEKKDILFGQFSTTVENSTKRLAWEEVKTKAKSLGACEASRDWKFIRDKMYGQWKLLTLAKKDKARKTGTGGGLCCILNEVDHKILEIVGKDSPIISGLPIPETGLSEITVQSNLSSEMNADIPSITDPQQNAAGTSNANIQGTSLGKTATRKRRFLHSDLLDLKRKKQVELLEVTIYNEKLNAYEKETKLGLPPSKFTQEFYKP